MPQNIKKYYLLLLLSALQLTLSLPTHAQQQRLKFSNTEDIAIAFYKTGHVVPNFKSWVTKRAPYNLTPPARRSRVMKAELLRLKTAYKEFNPQKNLLLIRTVVHLTPQIKQNKEGKSIYTLNLQFDKSNDVFYLPYEFLDQNIMVVPQKLQSLKTYQISEFEYNRIKSLPVLKKGHPLVMRLKPRNADFKYPYDVDGLAQWAFTTDIASMEIWNKRQGLIWEYTAPWYLSPHQQKIQTLYDDSSENRSTQGTIKNSPYLK
jgi:hypothetical protein